MSGTAMNSHVWHSDGIPLDVEPLIWLPIIASTSNSDIFNIELDRLMGATLLYKLPHGGQLGSIDGPGARLLKALGYISVIEAVFIVITVGKARTQAAGAVHRLQTACG